MTSLIQPVKDAGERDSGIYSSNCQIPFDGWERVRTCGPLSFLPHSCQPSRRKDRFDES